MFNPLTGERRSLTRSSRWRGWRAVVPVPSSAPPAPAAHPTRGVPSARWAYHGKNGALLGYVLGFDDLAGVNKDFPFLTWCGGAAGPGEWRWKSRDVRRPLYGLDRLAARPEVPVINLRTGRWTDFATGDGGGDPVSLAAYLAGCGQAAKDYDNGCSTKFPR